MSGFAARTLVHTKEGLKPIERLQMGEWVLSKPEDGQGDRAYKRVRRTFAHPPAILINVMFEDGPRRPLGTPLGENSLSVMTTWNHPIWAINGGWTPAIQLSEWEGEQSEVIFADGRSAKVLARNFVYETNLPHVGWVARSNFGLDGLSAEWDFDKNILHATNVRGPDLEIDTEHSPQLYLEDGDEDGLGLNGLFKAPVFNIEVDDFHTYFVGERGLWVHNKMSVHNKKVMSCLTSGCSRIWNDIEPGRTGTGARADR